MVRKDNFIAILEASPSARAPEFYIGPAGFVEGTADPSALKASSTTTSAAATAMVPSSSSTTSIDDLPSLAAATGALGDVLVLGARNGNVSFTHQKHKDLLQQECSTCHSNSTGRISGFGKEMAHKLWGAFRGQLT
ncbi:MAG TPA: cytochrome c3 family protein [Stenomitos sp.]